MQEMWALLHHLPGDMPDRRHRGECGGHSPRRGSASRMPWPPRRTRRGFPPLIRAKIALATFLLKILMPGFFVRDRPSRSSPRKAKKAGDFPARKPGEPSVPPASPAESSSTCSTHGRSPKATPLGAGPPDRSGDRRRGSAIGHGHSPDGLA